MDNKYNTYVNLICAHQWYIYFPTINSYIYLSIYSILVEDENFALFNYVNELSGNMELIQEAISGLKEEMEQFQQEGVALEQQRQTILQDLEAKLKSAECDTQVSEGKCSAAGRVLDQLKSGNLFQTHSLNYSHVIYIYRY